MEGVGEIAHRTVRVNGISMHVAEKGSGPVVLFLHGFPELWYSWRAQILGLAARGYRAVAPDLRGYGDTEAPPSTAAYSVFHIVGDIVALIQTLGEEKVFVVGHDWGALVAWYLCMFRPDLVKALVNLSVPFMPGNTAGNMAKYFKSLYGEDHYMSRFQEPGEIEKQFTELGTGLVLKKIFTIRDPGPIIIPKVGWISPSEQISLPSWLSEEDIDYYTSKFDKSGFTSAVNYYRCLALIWELTAPWTGMQIKVPAKLVVGDLDPIYHFPGNQDYIHKGGFKKDVPLLEEVVVMEGVAHFINQEKANEITDHIYEFIQKFSSK